MEKGGRGGRVRKRELGEVWAVEERGEKERQSYKKQEVKREERKGLVTKSGLLLLYFLS